MHNTSKNMNDPEINITRTKFLWQNYNALQRDWINGNK